MKQKTKKNTAIIGLGKTGISLIKWLLQNKAKDNLVSNQQLEKIIVYETNSKNIQKFLLQAEYDKEIKENKLVIKVQPESIAECKNELETNEVDLIYFSPGIGIKQPKANSMLEAAKNLKIKISSDIDLFFSNAPKAKYIGITGTNGKSTTTALIGWVLGEAAPGFSGQNHSDQTSVFIGGNIGTPILDLPIYNNPETIYVIELSSYQLDLISCLKLDVAICLNITPDHLDQYSSMVDYTKSKQTIFLLLKNRGLAIVGKECDYLVKKQNQKTQNSKLEVKRKDNQVAPLELNEYQKLDIISGKEILQNGISIFDDKIWIDGIAQYDLDISKFEINSDINNPNPNSSNFPSTSSTKSCLVGKHNNENIAAVVATCLYFGVTKEEIVAKCKTFKGLPHRLEYITTYFGYQVINDSKATNVAAVKYALDIYDNIYWIAGGISKDEGIIGLQEFFPKISCAYLIGKCAKEFAEVLEEFRVKYQICHELSTALAKIKEDINKTNCLLQENHHKNLGTILLSPACSSTDQWANFEERGKAFGEFFT